MMSFLDGACKCLVNLENIFIHSKPLLETVTSMIGFKPILLIY